MSVSRMPALLGVNWTHYVTVLDHDLLSTYDFRNPMEDQMGNPILDPPSDAAFHR